MSSVRVFTAVIAVSILALFGCQRDVESNSQSQETLAGGRPPQQPPATCNPNAYVVELVGETFTANGYEWVWRIKNPNPGNGNNGTIQALSHWGFRMCDQFDLNDLVSTSYSFDNVNWSVPVPAVYQPDNSQLCQAGNVIKFNAGTNGSNWTYFKLVLSANYNIGVMNGYYKSGSTTGCCTFTFQGVGCEREEGCSLSQGYWFANEAHVWPDVNGADPGNITLGGHHYTEAEGRAIWNASNAGGMKDSKKGFLQASAIMLSQVPASNTAVWDDVNIISQELSNYTKLSPLNLPHPNAVINAAAGRISNWITENHCD